MADVYQVIYEYINGSSISFKTNNLKIQYKRHGLSITRRPDGKLYVDDPGVEQRIFTCTALISGDTMDTLDGVQMAAITYDGTYPRLTKINWDGDSSESNITVALTGLTTLDKGAGWWEVQLEFSEYTA